MDIYDAIFFDDSPYEKYTTLNTYHKNSRIKLFIYSCLEKHTKIGSKISYYFSRDSIFDYLQCVKCELFIVNYEIPENCNYKTDNNKMYIPIITKIKDTEEDFHLKYLQPITGI